ncbi:uncharacterized protein LOC132306888 [Cornus florida]|uniref:uncharacterized protein LOC132306888 n=1 Tax=Cornus florida TaxID=4283 RepID=UPI00289C5841|nr:uncharacterized protein LOC132306888 [Cornus florida]XP_059660458.1 uncharacterized protein LOC132306888 [Cornus florida]
MEEGAILKLYELQYSDLMLLSSEEVPSSSSSSSSSEEIERLESITRSVMENLGPRGPGLLAITGVPDASERRRTLLSLARKLALVDTDDRKRILKEHSLGSDVSLKNLDRSVSSFAMQLKYVQGVESFNGKPSHEGDDSHDKERDYPDVERLRGFQDSEFKNFGNSFKELGYCMMELGLRLARVCDKALGGQELEQSLLESLMAKGRLIHYHSTLDNLILKEAAKRKGSTKGRGSSKFQLHGSRDMEESIGNEQAHRRGNEARSCGNNSNLWQQWHYDYGIFTVLTAPMFILPCHPLVTKPNGCVCVSREQECPSPSSHTYLQIFDPNKNTVCMVKASPESFIVQVGESADILSKGKLRATLHSVRRPEDLKELSRETFVVFLQPAWSKTLSLTEYPIEHNTSYDRCSDLYTKETCSSEHTPHKLTQELHKIVPPLLSRLKNGMTFAEFSQETTKQYYGGSGLQSKR